MTKNIEKLVKEYPKFVKRKTFTKDVYYRVRLLDRVVEGIPRRLLDIREFIVTTKRTLWLENGIYFNKEELDRLINILLEVRKDFYGTGDTPRDENTGNIKT